MRCITLTQPWASLVMLGAKKIETRSWGTRFRGPLAIHAAKGMPSEAVDFALVDPACRLLMERHDFWRRGDGKTLRLPRGAVVATCTLVGCYRIEGAYEDIYRRTYAAEHERAFGDYTPGRYAWVLADVVALPTPIPAKGALGLWEWQPPDDLRALKASVLQRSLFEDDERQEESA